MIEYIKNKIQKYDKGFVIALFILILFIIYCSFKFIGTQKDALSVIIASITVYIAYQQYRLSSFHSTNEFLKEKLQIVDELEMLFNKIKNLKIDNNDEGKYDLDEIVNEIYKLDLKTIILFKNKSFSSQLIRLVKKLKQDSYELDEYEHPNKTYKDGSSRGIQFHKDVDIDKEMVRVGNMVIGDLEKIYKFHENLQQSLLQTMRETRDFNILESVYKRKD